MKANMSVINGNRDSPLKSRRLSLGGSSRGVSTPKRQGTPGRVSHYSQQSAGDG